MSDSNKSTNFNKKNLIVKHLSMYHAIRMILQYDMIHTIHTLYHTIHEHLRYRTVYTRYDTYRMIRIAYRIILTTMSGPTPKGLMP